MLGVVALVIALVALGIGVTAWTKTTASPSSYNSPVGNVPTVNYTAVVGSDGTLAYGNFVNTTALTATGVYVVQFLAYLNGCTFAAGIGTTGYGTASPANIQIQGPTNGTNITVKTTNVSTGDPVDSSFHLTAICPGGDYAAINADGTYSTGAGVTGSGIEDNGTYYVLFALGNTYGCAYSGATGLSFSGSSSGTISDASLASNSTGVWVNTWNSAGNLTNESFHLEVYC